MKIRPGHDMFSLERLDATIPMTFFEQVENGNLAWRLPEYKNVSRAAYGSAHIKPIASVEQCIGVV